MVKNNINLNISHAFQKGRSFITNAKIHRSKRFVIVIDLENFFDCFHFGRVCGYFLKYSDFRLPVEVATVIAQLTCYQGKLPQGSPCSPIITNLICSIFDIRLLKFAKKYRLNYTRYADDLTFSTNNFKFLTVEATFFEELEKEIVDVGFRINIKKTKVQYRDSRQEVTGIIVNKNFTLIEIIIKSLEQCHINYIKQGSFLLAKNFKETIKIMIE